MVSNSLRRHYCFVASKTELHHWRRFQVMKVRKWTWMSKTGRISHQLNSHHHTTFDGVSYLQEVALHQRTILMNPVQFHKRDYFHILPHMKSRRHCLISQIQKEKGHPALSTFTIHRTHRSTIKITSSPYTSPSHMWNQLTPLICCRYHTMTGSFSSGFEFMQRLAQECTDAMIVHR